VAKRVWRFLVGSTAAAVAAAVLVVHPLAAQDREAPENLQVLASDMTRNEVTAIMRGFTAATGTRCSTCHVGEEDQPLSTYDFASDDKSMKLKAREMMRMVASINEALVALPDRAQPAVEVTCMTCHGGVRRPEPIETIVERTALDEGGDAAVARYRELRERYFGRRAYDFGERPLVSAGAALVGAERADEARAVLELALELHPRSLQALLTLGRAEEARGDTEAAIAAYRSVLEIEPNHTGAQRRLQALGGG
jgi:tetratricopeptide (TPR) repeat protein